MRLMELMMIFIKRRNGVATRANKKKMRDRSTQQQQSAHKQNGQPKKKIKIGASEQKVRETLTMMTCSADYTIEVAVAKPKGKAFVSSWQTEQVKPTKNKNR